MAALLSGENMEKKRHQDGGVEGASHLGKGPVLRKRKKGLMEGKKGGKNSRPDLRKGGKKKGSPSLEKV